VADLDKLAKKEVGKVKMLEGKETKMKKAVSPKVKKPKAQNIKKKKYKVVLVSETYVMYDFNGTNGWTTKFTSKDVSVGDEISL